MAKSHKHSEGVSVRRGVASTLNAPFSKASPGTQQDMNGPYPGRTGGANGLPTRTYDRTGGPSAGAAPTNRDEPPRTSPRDLGNRRRY